MSGGNEDNKSSGNFSGFGAKEKEMGIHERMLVLERKGAKWMKVLKS